MVAVVTGASRGIGKAVAKVFAAHGYDLLLCSKNEERLLQTVAELKEAYPTITIDAKAMDLGIKEKAYLFAEWVSNTAEGVDVLVNNAGTFLPGNISEEEDGTLESMININLYSAYWVTKKLLPKMMAAKTGHIFNMCSIAALQAYPNGGSYSISKFALLGFSKNLRRELMPHGVKVTAVIPGAVYTDSWAGFVEEERIIKAEDVALMMYAASRLSPQAVVEDIVLRPQLGDL
ncbi:MAG: SDR family oxidoreductase [Chitinophagaceae bacterium]